MKSQHAIGAPTCHDFPRFVIISEKSRLEVGNRWRLSQFFGKKRPLKDIFSKNYSKWIHHVTESRPVCKFREIWLTGNRQSRALFTWQENKTSARSPALASARIAPKICQGQLQTIYLEFPKFHPNPFTSGRVIAEPMNIVETRHKVFPILGESSSPSNEDSFLAKSEMTKGINCSQSPNYLMVCSILIPMLWLILKQKSYM